MFKKILSFLNTSKVTTLEVDVSGKPSDGDIQIAVAILLLEASGTDNDYAPEEIATAYKVLENHFKITNQDAEKILEQADSLRAEKEKINHFVKHLNQSFSAKQKQLVFALIWKIISADNQVSKEEIRIANQFKTRLQLSDEQAEEAKKLSRSI